MKTAPDPKDILEFQFKQLSNLKISDGFNSVPAACSLVVIDGKRGLIYTACDNKITVIKSGDNSDRDWKREYFLSSKVSRLSLNCDCSLLAVTLDHPTAYIYNAASFAQQTLELLREIKLSSTENVHVLDFRWNPCIPGALCTITSDYTVGSFNITVDKASSVLTILEKLEKLEVLCVAWSPKGKQLVVGCKNGDLLQLKPDLKAARNIAGPNPSIGSIIALLWISNYQFCAAYLDPQDSRINVLIIDAPKGEVNASFTSYEDITYGTPGVEGEEGGPRYYFEHIPEWGIIVAASSGSSEVAVLGSRDNGTTWEQWQLVDSGRAQLPLVRTSESYPVGLAVDRTSVNKLPWGGEGSTLPHPIPILHILGTSGQLCSFHMVNLISGIPAVCSPPTEIVPSSIQPRMSLAPTEISFNLTSGVTSTPRPKQIDTNQDKPKTIPTPSLFGDAGRVALPQPQVELNVPKPQIEIIETTPRVETIMQAGKEANQQEKIGIDSNICIHTYQEECSLFEKDLKLRKEVQIIDIGSPTERNQLVEKSEEMDRFLMELQETTASLASDISDLRTLLLQTFAWLEETKSRCSSGIENNPQGHDDDNKLKELRSRMYYIQSQLEQARRALDHEWLDHVNKEKNKMKVPRLEFVYQNMLRHSQIITREKNRIESLVKKWKNLTRGDITNSLNKSMANMSLLSLMSPGINNTNGAIEQRCKTIASRNCGLSREKQNKLRNLLSRSTTRIIKAGTPPPIYDRLRETLSSLASLSPPEQTEEQKTKSKPEPKPEQLSSATTPSTQTAKSPLASLDRIVANIGSVGAAQPSMSVQNRVPAPSAAYHIIKLPQVDSKARITAVTPQTPTPMGQLRQNKPIGVSLLGTPQTPKQLSTIPSGIKSVAISEVSPYTSNPPRSLTSSLLPAALTPTTVAATSMSKPFSRIDTAPFNSGTVRTEVPSMPPISTGISSAISSPTPTAAVAPAPPAQTKLESSFGTSSPPTSQVPGFGNMLKTPSPAATTASIGAKTSSPLQSFSFASKPANNTSFSFASKPTMSPPSSAAQTLDLSAMGLDLQAPSNTPVDNLTPANNTAGNNFFGSTGITPSSGSIFGGGSATPKDKAPGTIFGNSSFSSIFSGSTPTSNPTSVFGGNSTTPAVKPPIFGGATAGTPASNFGDGIASPPPSTFGSTATIPARSVGGEIPAASPTPSGFGSPPSSSSTSIFGNISSTANSASIFGGNSTPVLNTSTSGGATISPVQPFGAPVNTSPIKPSIFSGDSATSPTASGFGRPAESKPSLFGGVSASSPTISPFAGGTTGLSNTSIFGGNIANSPPASTFGGTTSSPTTASVFGAAPPVTPNQSIFGGAALNPNSPSNIGAVAPSPTASAQAFGQTATFGSKPEFGSMFGTSKPIFGGSGFASSTFAAAPQQTSGFGGFNTTPMGDGSMQKVFGGGGGSSTFENLATQEGGLTFGNLAQKQAEPAPPPAFSGKSSFQSWR